MHKFSVGQAVNLIPRVLHSAAAGEYKIRHLMPASDTDPESPRYCIKTQPDEGQNHSEALARWDNEGGANPKAVIGAKSKDGYYAAYPICH